MGDSGRSRVFISWSGDLSLQVARILKPWLEDVLQHVDCFVSEKDIVKGEGWYDRIVTELETCCCGIIVLTPESITRPWVLFEVGALVGARGRDRAMPLLVDLAESHLGGSPLNQLQGTKVTLQDMLLLLKSVNLATGEAAAPSDRVERAVAREWETFETAVVAAIKRAPGHKATPASKAQPAANTNDALLSDILRAVRETNAALNNASASRSNSLNAAPSYAETGVSGGTLLRRADSLDVLLRQSRAKLGPKYPPSAVQCIEALIAGLPESRRAIAEELVVGLPSWMVEEVASRAVQRIETSAGEPASWK